ncbi:MAG: stage II sporulation protein D [Clostridia bacterium]|nr:stage II sporulation protein D [Clostridia bacterium]
MKNMLIMTLIIFFTLIFFPLIAIVGTDKTKEPSTEYIKQDTTEAATAESAEEETVSLKVSSTGKVTNMNVEEYVYGAVCAEMPATFHTEALKAQAVACYTYMKYLKENSEAKNAVISDDSATHQAYATEDELREKWGNNYDIYNKKVKEAVNSVLYEYLAYENKTAMTVYHALSPGKTKSAVEVWSRDIPYLSSVVAPGDKLASDFTADKILTYEAFLKPFSDSKADEADAVLKNAETDDENFIISLAYGKQKFTNRELRTAYELKSPYFRMKNDDKSIIVTTYGKGHGVGMSQYSADYMARQGSTYDEILLHFYKGTELIGRN